MADFAVPTDVETAYEGSLPAGSEDRVQYLLNVVSARLRLLMPSLEARIEAADAAVADPDIESDLTILAREVVINAVLRKLPGSTQQTSSQTQSAGPFSTTLRFTTDTSRTFPDDDLKLLSGTGWASSRVGTIKLGQADYTYPETVQVSQ